MTRYSLCGKIHRYGKRHRCGPVNPPVPQLSHELHSGYPMIPGASWLILPMCLFLASLAGLPKKTNRIIADPFVHLNTSKAYLFISHHQPSETTNRRSLQLGCIEFLMVPTWQHRVGSLVWISSPVHPCHGVMI